MSMLQSENESVTEQIILLNLLQMILPIMLSSPREGNSSPAGAPEAAVVDQGDYFSGEVSLLTGSVNNLEATFITVSYIL